MCVFDLHGVGSRYSKQSACVQICSYLVPLTNGLGMRLDFFVSSHSCAGSGWYSDTTTGCSGRGRMSVEAAEVAA